MYRREQGIATTSIMIYIIVILIVISTLSVISTYFRKQVTTMLEESQSASTYVTFMSYFTKDIQENGNTVEKVDTVVQTENGNNYNVYYIAFSNGSQYMYYEQTKSIYKNDIKICGDVDICEFSKTAYGENKTLIQINFKANEFEKTGSNALKFYI